MQMPIWRTASKLRNFSYPCPHLASFHSTPASSAKRKGKFDFDKDEPKHGQEPKNYARYMVRRKRADAKRALNDFLLKGMHSKRSVQDEWATWYGDSKRSTSNKVEDFSDTWYGDQGQSNQSGRSRHSRQSNMHSKSTAKSRHKKYNFVTEEDGDSETTFEVNFGDKCYSWSFRTRDSFDFRNPPPGFEWRDNSNYARNGKGPRVQWGKKQDSSSNKKRSWECESDFEDEEAGDEYDKLRTAPSYSHRITLGLPPTGPLELNEVKIAFRASALKWHPDKHQGPSQAMAGEKFKSCVEAYKSLCAVLNRA